MKWIKSFIHPLVRKEYKNLYPGDPRTMSSSKNVKYNIKSNEATTIGSQEAARGVLVRLSDHYACTDKACHPSRQGDGGGCPTSQQALQQPDQNKSTIEQCRQFD